MAAKASKALAAVGIEFEIKQQILFITLSATQQGNAFSLSMAKLLSRRILKTKSVDSIPPDSYIGVVMQGRGRHFCAGGQLVDYAAMTRANQGKRVNREITAILNQFWNLPKPKVAIVHGDCFGGGVELLSCFDHIIAHPHVQFGLWQRRIGLSFGWGGFERLNARVSTNALQDWAVSARTFGTNEAKHAGLISEISIPSKSQALARSYISSQSRLSQQSGTAVKSLYRPSQDKNRPLETFEKLWWSDAHLAALKKFIQK